MLSAKLQINVVLVVESLCSKEDVVIIPFLNSNL